MKQSVRHSRRTLALMADVALQHTKAEMFEEVRPILAQLSERSLTPQVQRENIREGARRKDHSRIRTFQKSAPKGTIWKRISGRRNRSHLGASSEEDSVGTRSAEKLFREALQGSSSRKLFRQALQRSSSRKPFEEALRPQERKTAHGSALEGGCCDFTRTVHARLCI
jgi:hypothetical protein